ncbi:MAG: hypothetical protein OEL57_13880 [Trichlorobacter sp.]|uniref:hypothetical protein n=1 Tax=Trichlorobacter sp. TaxID=2911007 RepID=UPI002569417E|nr:hypothetical protein [Trichlorobacter sp.]MDK9718973.1 hypothetical protein [Trichlorobacter sp.]
MKANSIHLMVAILCSVSTSAYAASAGVGGEEAGLLIWALIGFGVLVVMMQAVPAMVMLYAMLKGVFAPADTTVVAPKA